MAPHRWDHVECSPHLTRARTHTHIHTLDHRCPQPANCNPTSVRHSMDSTHLSSASRRSRSAFRSGYRSSFVFPIRFNTCSMVRSSARAMVVRVTNKYETARKRLEYHFATPCKRGHDESVNWTLHFRHSTTGMEDRQRGYPHPCPFR